MRGIKIGSVFAVCGFLLSFLSGLFSHTSILSVLLKAVIFAIIFGLLGFLIDFVFVKFLAGEAAGEFNSESGSEPKFTSGKQNSTGSIVDITIQDEDLEQSGSDNHFVVNDNHQMLNDSDLENKTVQETTPENGFVPLKNFETLKSLSGKEAVHPESTVISAGSTESTGSSKNNGLDTLPEMGNLSFENDNSSTTSEEEVDTDGEFVSSTNTHKSSNEPTEIKDASLMAKAISSILSDEDA